MRQDAPETVILATDEAARYLQATTRRVWAPRGHPPVVRAAAGRTKTCCYGRLNLCTGREIVSQCATMNADMSAAHLHQILMAYPDVPILLLRDRAPGHRGAAIRAVLEAHPRLELLQLPVAAPDLNPQEQVWKATRTAVRHNHTVAQLPSLVQQFEAHLNHPTFTSSFLEHRGFFTVYPSSNC